MEIPNYTFKMRGKLLRPWPKTETIKLLDCIFKPGPKKRDFFIQTEVYADEQENAKISGRRNCKDAINFFELIIQEQILLDNNYEEIKKENENSTQVSNYLPSKITITNPNLLSNSQIKEIKKAQNIINDLDEEQHEILIKSLHWWANGKREQDRIDQYIKFWIALEILVEGKGQKLVKKVKEQLIQLYPNSDEKNIRELVGRIFGLRGNIVHKGLREPQEVINYTRQLETILEDLLSSRLNLQFKVKAEKYFEMK